VATPELRTACCAPTRYRCARFLDSQHSVLNISHLTVPRHPPKSLSPSQNLVPLGKKLRLALSASDESRGFLMFSMSASTKYRCIRKKSYWLSWPTWPCWQSWSPKNPRFRTGSPASAGMTLVLARASQLKTRASPILVRQENTLGELSDLRLGELNKIILTQTHHWE
jgi:hypothetical protein